MKDVRYLVRKIGHLPTESHRIDLTVDVDINKETFKILKFLFIKLYGIELKEHLHLKT